MKGIPQSSQETLEKCLQRFFSNKTMMVAVEIGMANIVSNHPLIISNKFSRKDTVLVQSQCSTSARKGSSEFFLKMKIEFSRFRSDKKKIVQFR